ncbi:MAG: SDR family oxidoreductase [Hyphomicrobiaceae bacterium]
MGRLEGKRAFCTAAGAGIGRATALAFAAEGAHVVATDVNLAALDGLKENGIAEVKKLDVRDSLAVSALAKDLDAIDILFNAAGFVHSGTVLTTTEQDWAFSFDINVTSMHRTICAFLPKMLKRGGGSIVNVGSVAGPKGVPNRYVYSATKSAVIGLSRSVAADFIRDGIRCNVICPGTVDTPSLDDRIRDQAAQSGKTTAEVRQAFIDRQPMGRLGTAEEIAALAVYLASDESRFVTGRTIEIDGGMTL